MKTLFKSYRPVIALCSLCLLISGCGGQDSAALSQNDVQVTQNDAATENIAEETGASEPSEYEPLGRQYGGADFTVASMRRDDSSLWIAYGYREMYSEEENGENPSRWQGLLPYRKHGSQRFRSRSPYTHKKDGLL